MGGSGVLKPLGWCGAECAVWVVGAGHSTLTTAPPAPSLSLTSQFWLLPSQA